VLELFASLGRNLKTQMHQSVAGERSFLMCVEKVYGSGGTSENSFCLLFQRTGGIMATCCCCCLCVDETISTSIAALQVKKSSILLNGASSTEKQAERERAFFKMHFLLIKNAAN
jgi:hypothetical protein